MYLRIVRACVLNSLSCQTICTSLRTNCESKQAQWPPRQTGRGRRKQHCMVKLRKDLATEVSRASAEPMARDVHSRLRAWEEECHPARACWLPERGMKTLESTRLPSLEPVQSVDTVVFLLVLRRRLVLLKEQQVTERAHCAMFACSEQRREPTEGLFLVSRLNQPARSQSSPK